MNENDKELLVAGGCLSHVIAFAIGALIMALMFTSCKTKTVVVKVPEVHTDTLYQVKEQKDSIWQHDSVYVHQWMKGDTIYQETAKWHTKYIERLRTDTLYQHRVDSVSVPYPVEKKVPAELNWWQHLRLWVGNIALMLLAFLAVCYLLRRKWPLP